MGKLGKLTISMAIFNSYVKLPEGSHKKLYRTIKNTKKVGDPWRIWNLDDSAMLINIYIYI